MTPQWLEYLIPILLIPLMYLLSYVGVFLLSKLERVARHTATKLDDRMIEYSKKPLKLIFVATGLYLAVYYTITELFPEMGKQIVYQIYTMEAGQKIAHGVTLLEASNTFFLMVGILLFTYAAVRLSNAFFDWYLLDMLQGRKRRRQTVFKFSKNIIAIVVYAIGFLIILSSIGIEIGPLVAGLGIGGLAVALALQDTLTNFFAGVYLTAEQPIRIGDFIQISSEEKGYVEEIGWRSTKIRTVENNLMVIPNSKLANSIITNYEGPHPELSFWVPIGVSYKSNLDKVEKVVLKVANDVMKDVEGGVPDFEPYVRYKEFGDSSINFSVGLRAKARGNMFLLRHEFIKRLKKAFDKEGIEIPYPQTDVHLKKD
ncbi:MAG: mechanosensitive ion channel family protein [Candidatus Diapherotrites archaeon]|nr:mechanosensitive ion channel family protein [Candidatus Diapherotrites archaeon]